jgi:ATP-dependent protease ClpP protease subunit
MARDNWVKLSLGGFAMTRLIRHLLLCSLVFVFADLAYAQENPAKQTQLDNPPGLEAPTYLLIPVKGGIGRDFTAATMKAYLQSAEKQKASVVVLEVDSGGGDIHDAEEIVDLIIAHKGLRFVALVRRALSAGATITLACQDIYVTESATIGGAVSYSVGTDGMPRSLPADVAEKFQSVWRAVCRKAAEHGGHPSLIAEAMTDPAFTLTMRKEGDKVVLERNGKGDVLKADNRILTLTAREAVSCQLAQGIVDNLDALGPQLSMSGWKALTSRAGESLPERNGIPGQFSQSVFYDLVFQKAASLKMTAPMTDLQNKKAKEEFQAWLNQQKFVGRSVNWQVKLDRAKDRETITYVIGYPFDTMSGLQRDHPIQVREKELLVDSLKNQLSAANANLTRAKEQLAKNPPKTPYLRDPRMNYPPITRENVIKLQQEVSRITQQLNEAEAYPFVLMATGFDEPMILIQAIVSKQSGDSLAKESPGSKVTLCGVIEEVRPYLYEDRNFLVLVFLEHCSVVDDKPAAGSPAEHTTLQPPGTNDSEDTQKAKSDLNLAHAFRRNGLNEKAQALLKSIIAAYPGTPEAEKAQQELQEIEEEIRKAQEDQKAPNISSQEKK